jgi:probable phosphoglycerate mutase
MNALDADPRWAVWNRERGSARAPGGESMAEAGGRLTAFVDGLRERHSGKACVVVSHADVIRAALCHVLGLSLDRYDRFDVDTASLSTLVVWDGGGKLVRLNETASETLASPSRRYSEVLGQRPSLEVVGSSTPRRAPLS